ncbi:MAG: hypothetical protein PHQ66_00925 [Candidatus Nanoarchaeia archaeon]|nr:hypothetical protein [Candidatus Nanoarchaeia archaeon]MDD5358460.1 hypothetical protein [Candidatus Nanoarchaeia archaeon]MDD5588974.1 hypothetical protein [Candidatus Nanoarchaeia archaeon]
METKGLFELRDKMIEFDDLNNFKNKIEEIIDKNFEFPMVVGYKNFDSEKNWEVRKLSPVSKSDRITVENYIEGLNYVIEEMKNRTPLKFSGTIDFEGIDSLHYSNWDSNIFWASMRLEKSALYILDIYFSRDKNEKMGYAAAARKEETAYDEIMSKFIGPNKKYHKLLL